MVKLFSKNSNLCDHNSPTLQIDRQTDRQTTCDRNTALCTEVHRAVKTELMLHSQEWPHRKTNISREKICSIHAGLYQHLFLLRGDNNKATYNADNVFTQTQTWQQLTAAHPVHVLMHRIHTELSDPQRTSDLQIINLSCLKCTVWEMMLEAYQTMWSLIDTERCSKVTSAIESLSIAFISKIATYIVH